MSCVLRVSMPDIGVALQLLSIHPYRVDDDTAHFDVSDADFNNFNAQINDALAFLSANYPDVQLLMGQPGASGELDFGIEWRDVSCQFDTMPSRLVRVAGEFGLALTLSHYHISEERDADTNKMYKNC